MVLMEASYVNTKRNNEMMLKKNAVLAIDYDGTCVTNVDPPEIGESIGAAPWLRMFVVAGARLVLWTCRDGEGLKAAIEWFRDNDIPLWSIQANPEQGTWSISPKLHAHLFIDDRGYGMPLTVTNGSKPHVDWEEVGPKVLVELLRVST